MKELNNFIQEKLIINKNIKSSSIYYFGKIHDKDLSIKLPFSFYIPELKESVKISEIEHKQSYFNEEIWIFKEKYPDGKKQIVVTLSEGGLYNVFIRGPVSVENLKSKPLISYVNGKYIARHLVIQADNYKDVIIGESNIDEKLVINKNLKSNNSFQFDQNKSIKLPFTLEIVNGPSNKRLKLNKKKKPVIIEIDITYMMIKTN